MLLCVQGVRGEAGKEGWPGENGRLGEQGLDGQRGDRGDQGPGVGAGTIQESLRFITDIVLIKMTMMLED